MSAAGGPKPQTPRKPVYKHVLESSYDPNKDWPKIGASFVTEILQDLCSPIGHYRKELSAGPRRAKKRKVTAKPNGPVVTKSSDVTNLEACCIVGFNACYRHLESRAQLPSVTDSGNADHSIESTTAVFVCKEDLQMVPQQYEQFPMLCKLAAESGGPVFLIGLPKQAEIALGKALGLPRLCCLVLRDDKPTQTLISKIKANVPQPTSEVLDQVNYKELKIKTLISAAPIAPKKSTNSKGESAQDEADV